MPDMSFQLYLDFPVAFLAIDPNNPPEPLDVYREAVDQLDNMMLLDCPDLLDRQTDNNFACNPAWTFRGDWGRILTPHGQPAFHIEVKSHGVNIGAIPPRVWVNKPGPAYAINGKSRRRPLVTAAATNLNASNITTHAVISSGDQDDP